MLRKIKKVLASLQNPDKGQKTEAGHLDFLGVGATCHIPKAMEEHLAASTEKHNQSAK